MNKCTSTSALRWGVTAFACGLLPLAKDVPFVVLGDATRFFPTKEVRTTVSAVRQVLPPNTD